MLEKRIIFVGILMVIGFSMIACSNSNHPSAFVGKWELERGNFQFDKAELFKDGTGIVDDGGFSWKVVNKRLVITHPFFALACDYKISGSRITLTTDDGDIGTFVNRNKVNETKSDGAIDEEHWEAYLLSPHTLKKFKDRFNEIKNDGTIDEEYWWVYVESTHTLKKFNDMLNEIKNDGTIDEEYWWVYLYSPHTLKAFKDRFNEIKNDGTIGGIYWGAYLYSPHTLKAFKDRFNEIKNDGTIDEKYWWVYLASTYTLKKFKDRLNELENY